MVAFDWGAVAGAGLNALGGIASSLFGKKKSKDPYKQAFSAQMDAWTQGPEAMVRGAKRAGLHPLAVLGGNWSAGTPIPVGDGQSSWGDFAGDGLQAIGDGFASGAARKRQQEADDDLKFQQILNNLETTRVNDANIKLMEKQGRMYDSEVLLNSARSRSLLTNGRANSVGAAGPAGALNLPFGQSMNDGGAANAQAVQDRYGDIVENGYGLWKLLEDVMRSPDVWKGMPRSVEEFIWPGGAPKPSPRPGVNWKYGR